ncbi:MAG: ATP-binding protein [Chlamydiia bacterium]|nr:ATP-binding protein [Chlamydiia bacterium]
MERMMMGELIAWKNNKKRKPLILKGARQVGKTFLLKSFGKENYLKVHYLNFENEKKLATIFERDLNPQRILDELSFHLNTSINKQKDLIIFDEIQDCPRALTSLKYFSEEMPELSLASAGSLLGIHFNGTSFPVGKVDFLTLYPMCFLEFLQAIGEQRSIEQIHQAKEPLSEIIHEHIWERLKWYFITGGLPEVVKTFRDLQSDLFEAFQASRKVQEALILAYNSDMAKHAGKVNAMHLDRLWKATPYQLARDADKSIPRFSFKDAVPGINRYSKLANVIDWLEAAGLILKVKITTEGSLPFSAHAAENAFKLLLFDVGILGALSELSPDVLMKQSYGSYKGYFAENFVAQEFLVAGFSSLYSWKEKQAKVDYLMEEKGLPIPIEVKAGKTAKAKSASLFQKKYNSPYKVILSGQNLLLTETIKRFPLYMTSRVI